MVELPNEIYSAAQVRGLDRAAIEVFGVPSYELMCRAGEAALDSLRRRWPEARELAVVCGAGNNAGDGYVLARLAIRDGLRVQVLSLVPGERLSGDALHALQDFESVGGSALAYDGSTTPRGDVVADAVLGTGLDRPLQGAFAAAVASINAAERPVFALDIPSGLHADTGQPLGGAVRATATLSFVGLKLGLFLGAGIDYRGELEFADLGVPAQAYASVTAPLRRLDRSCIRRALAPRRRSAHKGSHGSLLLIGGAPGMSGAIRLAAEAALRAGAGLVRVATHPDSVAMVTAGRPEIMCQAVAGKAELAALLARSDGLVVGPGLGTSLWAQQLWDAAVGAGLPLVLDADGLNLLAAEPERRANWILTPHAGEAGRLLGVDAVAIQADRLAAVRQLASRYGGVVVLKGAGSLIATSDNEAARLCDRGNPGMASAGMGDVLAGVLGALLVQGADPQRAADAGVYVHARAGDEAAAGGERGLLAADLMSAIRRWVNTQ